MSDPGSKESAYRALHGHREHKTQTGGERQFGFYSRLISNLVPAPNVNHSGSSPLCCCTKTQFPKEKNSVLGQLLKLRSLCQQVWKLTENVFIGEIWNPRKGYIYSWGLTVPFFNNLPYLDYFLSIYLFGKWTECKLQRKQTSSKKLYFFIPPGMGAICK